MNTEMFEKHLSRLASGVIASVMLAWLLSILGFVVIVSADVAEFAGLKWYWGLVGLAALIGAIYTIGYFLEGV